MVFPWPSVAFRGYLKSLAQMLHSDITDPILGAFYHVHRELGHGFLESVYERSMITALEKRGVHVDGHASVKVHYAGQVVGDFYADLIVENRVVVELKACRALDENHEAQLLNYLRATTLEVGLLLHFGPTARFRRLILTNDRKQSFEETTEGH